jgi:hypothetical protein
VLQAYQNAVARMNEAANQPFVAYGQTPCAYVAGLSSAQKAGMQNINSLMGSATKCVQGGQNYLMQGANQGIGLQNQSLCLANQGLGMASGINLNALQGICAARAQGQQYLGGATCLTANAIRTGNMYAGQAQPFYTGALQAAAPMTAASQQFIGAGTQNLNPTAVLPAVSAFENPYTRCVINATQRAMAQQNAQQASNLQGCAIMKGAYGGCRAGIAQANLAYQQNLANQQTLANLYCKNYSQALAAAQQQQGVCLAAQQANRAAQQYGAQQAAALAQQQYNQVMGVGTGLAALGQQQYGQNLGTGAQLNTLGNTGYSQGIGAAQAQAGIGQNIFGNAAQTAGLYQGAGNNIANTSLNAGNAYANLGMQNQQLQLANANAQMQAGLVCQQTEQAKKTAGYNTFQQQQGYPFQTASAVANTAEATGAASGSTSTGTSHTSSGFAAGGAVGRPSKYYGGGLGASSQGGAVFNPGAYARGGYDAGGTPGRSYYQTYTEDGSEYWADDSGNAVSNDDPGLQAFIANGQKPVTSTGSSLQNEQLVNNAYQAVFGHAPDPDGLKTWTNELASGRVTPQTLNDVLFKNAQGTDVEAARRVQLENQKNAQYEGLINNAYGGLGRSGIGTAVNNIDQAGHDYWLNQLKSGAITPDQFQAQFAKGAETAFANDPNNPSVQYANAYASSNPNGGIRGTQCANTAYYNMQKYGPIAPTTNGFNPAGFKPVLCGDVIKYQCPNNPSVSYTSAQLASMTGAPPCITALKGGANMVYNPNLYQKPGCATTNQYGFASGNAAGVGNLPASMANAAYRPTNTQCAFLSGLGNLFNSYQPQQQNTYMPKFNFGSACTANPMGAGAYGALPTANLKGTSSMAGGYSPYATQQYTQQQYQAPAQQQYQAYAPQQPMYNDYYGSYQQPNYGMRSSATYGQPSPAYNATGYGQQPSGGPIALATEQATGTYSGGASGQYSGNWADAANTQNAQMATTGQTAVPGASAAKPFANGGRAGFALAGAVGCASQFGCDRAARMALGAINPYAASPNAGGGYAANIPAQYVSSKGLQGVAPPTPQKKASGLATVMQMPQQAAGAIEGVEKLGTAGKDAYKWATEPAKARGGRMGFATTGTVPCCCSYVTNRTNFGDYGSQPYGAAGATGSPQVPNSKSGYVMPGLAPNPWSHIQPLKPASLPAAPTPQNPLKTAANMAGQAKTLASLPSDISKMKTGLGNLFGGASDTGAASTAATSGMPGAIDLTTPVPANAATGLGSAGANAASAAAPAVADTSLAASSAMPAAIDLTSGATGLGAAGGAAAIPEAAGKGAAAIPEAAGKGAMLLSRGGAAHYAHGGFVPRTRFADGGPEDAPAADLPSENANEAIGNGLPPGVSETEAFGKKEKPQQSSKDLVEDYLQRTINRESRGNEFAKSTTSTAGGLGQVINSTARSWLDKNNVPYDPNASHIAATLPKETQIAMNRDLIRGHIDALQGRGLDPSYGNVTMAHFLGDAGGPAFVKNMLANPDAPATSFVTPQAASKNQSIFFKNGQPRSAQEVYNLMEKAGQGGGGGSAMSYAPVQRMASGASDAINSIMSGGKEATNQMISGGKDIAGGISDAASGVGDWFTQNKSWILPILAGLGAAGQASGQGMGRGSSILSGLGGFATQYGNMAYQQSQINKNNIDLFNQNVIMTRDENGAIKATDKLGRPLSQQQVEQLWSQATGNNPALRAIGSPTPPVVPANATQEQIAATKPQQKETSAEAGAQAAAPKTEQPAIGGQPKQPSATDQAAQTAFEPAPGALNLNSELSKLRQVALTQTQWPSDPNQNPNALLQQANSAQQEAARWEKVSGNNANYNKEYAATAHQQALDWQKKAMDYTEQANKLVEPIISGNKDFLAKRADSLNTSAMGFDKETGESSLNSQRDMQMQDQLAEVLKNHKFGPGTELWQEINKYKNLVPGLDTVVNYFSNGANQEWASASQDAQKKAETMLVQAVSAMGLQRAPASSAQHLSKIVPGIEVEPGAAYDIITNQRAYDMQQLDMNKAWREARTSHDKNGYIPNSELWKQNWVENNPIENYKHAAHLAVPTPTGMTPNEVREYGPKISDPSEIQKMRPGTQFMFASGPNQGRIGVITSDRKAALVP